jgi:hypothetical protein
MAGGAGMALGSLISLAFCLKRLAGVIWRIAENLNYPNHIRGPDGRAFPLPSRPASQFLRYVAISFMIYE